MSGTDADYINRLQGALFDARERARRIYFADGTFCLAETEETAIEFRKGAALNLAEFERLTGELNAILHPNDEGRPAAPSMCDLVAFVQRDLKTLRARNETLLEFTQSMGFFFDQVAEALGFLKPKNPIEAAGLCFEILAAIATLKEAAAMGKGTA